jgi:hypothetical protein
LDQVPTQVVKCTFMRGNKILLPSWSNEAYICKVGRKLEGDIELYKFESERLKITCKKTIRNHQVEVRYSGWHAVSLVPVPNYLTPLCSIRHSGVLIAPTDSERIDSASKKRLRLEHDSLCASFGWLDHN